MKVYTLWIAGELEDIFHSEEDAKEYLSKSSYSQHLKDRSIIEEVEVK
jgi:hypothetical protein